MSPSDAPRDGNNIPTALFQVDGQARGVLLAGQIDQATGRILVDATGGGSGTVTQIDAGAGIKLTPDPITTTGEVALTDALAPIATLGTANQLIRVNAGATALEYFTAAAGGVDSVVGTAARISVNSTDPANPIVNIDTSYVGQNTITTLGTITTGVWNGTAVVGQYGGTGVANTGKTLTLSGNTILGSNADTLAFVTTGNTSVTLPTSGTLATTTYVPTTITVANEAADATCFPLFVTAATGDLGPKTNAGLLFDSTTARLTATLITGTTSVTSASILASSNDSGAIGASGTAFADLFLASGGVINWNAGNSTITHSAGLLTTNVPVTITGLATASGFEPTATTATGNRMYLPAASTLGWSIGGTGELQLTSTALSPISDDGLALGTTALGWQSLFGDTGFVINIENGNWVATHTSAILTVGTGDLRVTTVGTDTASVVTVGGTQTLTSKTLTAPAIGGAMQLAENASMTLDATLSADGTYSGVTIAGTAGATLAFGDLVYLAAADSRWKLVDADASATAGPVWIGMCVLAAAADGNATTILLQGNIRADANFPALTISAPVYASTTPGDIQVAAPSGSADIVRIVGHAITADAIYFNPEPTWIVIV